MPANVDKMFSVNESTWHGLEDRMADYPTMQEVKDYFGFEVVRRPLYIGGADGIAAEEALAGWDALVRSDNEGFLHATRDSYAIVQPDVVVDLTEALVQGGDKKYPVKLTTGGLLDEGRVMWTLAEVDRDWYVKGDESAIRPYVLVVNSFDKTYALMSKTTGVRVVCQNTLDLSLAGEGSVFRFKHTSNVMDRVDQARSILTGSVQAIDSFIELSNDLVDAKVSKQAVNLFLGAFIPEPPKLEQTDTKMAHIIEAREAVLDILSGSTGTITPKHSGTAYGLFQAGVEFLDFSRPSRTADSLFERTMLKPDKAKAQLLSLVRKAAKV